MKRITGAYQSKTVGGEEIRAFIPRPLPPCDPPLRITGQLEARHAQALVSLGRLSVAGNLVPSTGWFLYGFVRKEAVISSQIEGTQATLKDVLTYEATRQSERAADVEEVCNYVDALEYGRRELGRPKGLPICVRLFCNVHARLLRGVRGADKQPGNIRTSQNWIGGTRPGNARFVPPPPDAVPGALAALERWIHASDPLPPLVRAGLAHVQFETIHPFLDGNGRVGRLLIAMLVEHWGLLSSPLLYLSLAFKRHREEYYQRLTRVRDGGDWEGWTDFFLSCVSEAAEDGVASAHKLFTLLGRDRHALIHRRSATVPAIRLLDALPEHPVVTMQMALQLLGTSKPTTLNAIAALCKAGILEEITGKRRDRVYAYANYLNVLSQETQLREAPTTASSTRKGGPKFEKTLKMARRHLGRALEGRKD